MRRLIVRHVGPDPYGLAEIFELECGHEHRVPADRIAYFRESADFTSLKGPVWCPACHKAILIPDTLPEMFPDEKWWV